MCSTRSVQARNCTPLTETAFWIFSRDIAFTISGTTIRRSSRRSKPNLIAVVPPCSRVMFLSLPANWRRVCAGLREAAYPKLFFAAREAKVWKPPLNLPRARTRRNGLLYAQGAFHGLTCGALSLMDNPFWGEGFGPMLPETHCIPFGDLGALEQKLKGNRMAAFIVEPVQAEGGIRIPQDEYLKDAQDLCHRYGTLFVLDEVQTGMYRTGRFLAAHHFAVQPDMVVLAKALSGGLVPIGAVLMSEEVYESVYTSLKRAIVHTSTYSENGLAMRAGIATLDVLEREQLGPRATVMGDELRRNLARHSRDMRWSKKYAASDCSRESSSRRLRDCPSHAF